MVPAARIAAAIEALADIMERRRPAADALKDWGVAHRFAGSKDRAAIAAHVYDALRRRSSAAWIMGADDARAVVLGSLARQPGCDPEKIAGLFSGEGHAPAVLTGEERQRLSDVSLAAAPDHVRGDYPEWLAAEFTAAFGPDAAAEGEALASRAPVDLRVNTLKTTRGKAARALAHLGAAPTPHSPIGLRLPLGPDGRGPAVVAEDAFARGHVEPQDEGSQLAALLAGARTGDQVVDLCAGGGGKTLALAAAMENRGQIFATDPDGRRLAPIHARLDRAGVRNVQVRAPKGRGGPDPLAGLEGRCDIVLIDAPCTGVGAWRRNPDAKWRMRPGALGQRLRDQDEALARGAEFPRPEGMLVYVTCSLLIAENEARVAAFLAARPDFAALGAGPLAARAGLPDLARFASPHGPGLRLSPRSAGTDGFYVAGLVRGR